MSDTTRSYDHPGITDPAVEEQPKGAGSFGSLPPPATPPASGLPSETIDLAKEFSESGVEGVLTELDQGLIGLSPVKTRIREIAALLLVERVRRRLGLYSEPPALHMSFTGNPVAPARPRLRCVWPLCFTGPASCVRAILFR